LPIPIEKKKQDGQHSRLVHPGIFAGAYLLHLFSRHLINNPIKRVRVIFSRVLRGKFQGRQYFAGEENEVATQLLSLSKGFYHLSSYQATGS